MTVTVLRDYAVSIVRKPDYKSMWEGVVAAATPEKAFRLGAQQGYQATAHELADLDTMEEKMPSEKHWPDTWFVSNAVFCGHVVNKDQQDFYHEQLNLAKLPITVRCNFTDLSLTAIKAHWERGKLEVECEETGFWFFTFRDAGDGSWRGDTIHGVCSITSETFAALKEKYAL